MKILIIDNNIDPFYWGSKDLMRLAKLATGATIYVRRAPQEDLPKSPEGFDRIIVSGSKTSALDDSPWVGQLIDFIKQALDRNLPFLGVCYGHQMLARALGGKEALRKGQTPEFGWTQIHTQGSSPLFHGVPSSFYSFSAHFDEVAHLPPGMKRLAYSDACELQAFQLQELPVYGIQFHPEKSVEEAKRILIERKKTKSPPKLLNPDRSNELFDPKLGETIFKNFLQTQT